MKKKRISKFYQALKMAMEVLDSLEEAGINVGRLIQLSNAQGPQAEQIRHLVDSASAESLGVDQSVLDPFSTTSPLHQEKLLPAVPRKRVARKK